MLDGESELIRRAVNGEPSAFGSLYDHYHTQIYRFVYLRVSHREDAEDLTHRTFVSAWEKIGNYKERGFPFSSWLYRIARNAVIDHYRTRKEHVRWEEVSEEVLSDVPDLVASIEAKREAEKVYKALLKLRSDHQEVIILRLIEELSVRETAEALGKSEAAVKTTQHRALKELKKELKMEE